MKLSDLPDLWRNVRGVLNARYYLRRAERVGARVRVWGRPHLHVNGRLIVGDRVRFSSIPTVLELAVGSAGVLEIGDNVYINCGGSIAAMSSVRIGNRCHIGSGVLIMDNEFHRLEPDRRDEMPESRPVVLEDNVWLGVRVIVMPGVTIGKDSVIGAGSIVTRDIPPGVVAVGAPARVVRSL